MSSPSRRYRIVTAVGKGAFGTVYHAQMVGEGGFTKDVAIKLMNRGEDDEIEALAARHRDEARLLGLIRHRSILQVDGLVRLKGSWAVVMEYIDGANLHQMLRAGAMPLGCALETAAEVASALHVAHSARRPDGQPLGLVHRDIKPSNIQLTTAGEVKVLDFGIARATFDTRESETMGMILGTLTYMAPERLDGIDGPEGDIYALGVVLVEIATRRRMKKTSSSRERHAETIRLAEDYVVEAFGDDGEALRAVVCRMLAYDPEDRPDAAEAERILWALRDEAGAPRLREWCPVGVRTAQELARDRLPDDELSGDILTEQSQTMMRGEVPPEPGPPGMGRALAVGGVGVSLVGLAGLAIVALLGFVGWLQLPGDDLPIAEPDPVDVPAVAAPVEPEPEPEPEPELAEPEPEPEPAPAPVRTAPAPPPRPAPAPTAVPVPEAPMPDAPDTTEGTVAVTGDEAKVTLTGAAGRYGPGRVPEGSYEVSARFGDADVTVGTLIVLPNHTHTIRCVAAMRLCRLP